MGKGFMCSLIKDGVLGGGIYVTDKSVIYRTGKLTVSDEIRNLELSISQIESVNWEKGFIAVFTMKNGITWKFLIFNRKGFQQAFQETGLS